MRPFLVAAVSMFAAFPAAAADCTADVSAAFEKQRTSKAFRVAMTQPTAEGPVEMTVDYVPPDRMLQTVVAPHMPGDQQTMLVKDRAFSGSGGSFEELLPHLAQSVISEVQTALGKPANFGTFECLGKQSYEGKEYTAFRSADPAPKPDSLARIVYIDATTGLPAYNVVAQREGGGEPAMKATYSYPTDIQIEAPANAPVHKGPQ